jgi:hypothetical protein
MKGEITTRAAALTALWSWLLRAAFAIEVTEPAGAEHGYPGLCDIRQWMESNRLHVVITYKFPDGQLFEENALFRQQPELMQEHWSWKE